MVRGRRERMVRSSRTNTGLGWLCEPAISDNDLRSSVEPAPICAGEIAASVDERTHNEDAPGEFRNHPAVAAFRHEGDGPSCSWRFPVSDGFSRPIHSSDLWVFALGKVKRFRHHGLQQPFIAEYLSANRISTVLEIRLGGFGPSPPRTGCPKFYHLARISFELSRTRRPSCPTARPAGLSAQQLRSGEHLPWRRRGLCCSQCRRHRLDGVPYRPASLLRPVRRLVSGD